MAENTNECVIEWIPGRDYVGLTAKNGSAWKNRCEELVGVAGLVCIAIMYDKHHPDD